MPKASKKSDAGREESVWLQGRKPIWLIVVAGLVAHAGCLGSQFFLDDVLQIRDHDNVLDGTWWELGYRKWTYFWYWLQYKVFGMSPVGFHVVNLILHIGVALMVFVFGRDVVKGEGAVGVALCGAVLFAVHPLGSEIPNYARAQDMAWVTLFCLLAGWMAVRFLREFRWPWLVGVVLSVVGATYSKEPGLAHVGMTLLFVVLGCCPGDLVKRVKERWTVVLGVGVGGVLVLWLSGVAGEFIVRATAGWGIEGFGWHAVTLCRVFWAFVGLLFWPSGLCCDHFVAATESWEDPQAMPAVVGVILWVLLATGLMFKARTRLVGMCLWLFAGAIVVRMLYFINEFMPEYRIYPGLPFMCLGLMVVLWAMWRKLLDFSPEGLMALVIIVLAAASEVRAFKWHDLETLCEDTLDQYPGHLRAIWVMQRHDSEEGNWAAVLERHKKVKVVGEIFRGQNERLKGKRMSPGHHALADVACAGYYAEALAATGKVADAMEVMRRVEVYLKTIGRFNEESEVFVFVYYHSLGRVYEELGEYEKALEALQKTDGTHHRRVDIRRLEAKLEAAGGE